MKKISLALLMVGICFFSGCTMWENWFGKKAEEAKEVEVKEETTAEVKSAVINVDTQEEFKKEVLENEQPVIAKFSTSWCGVCKQMAPIFDKISQTYKDKMSFVKVDAEKLSDTAKEYEVKGYPTFIFFKDGKEVEKIEGGISEQDLISKIEEVLK